MAAVPRFTQFVPLAPPQTTGPATAVTVNAAVEVWPLKVAVMSDVPMARPVARPVVGPTEATPEAAEVQLAVVVTAWLVKSLYVPVATNC